MKKILAIGASNSNHSINRQFANYVASSIENAEVTLLDLNDFDIPVFGVDLEAEIGSPEPAQRFKQLIRDSDGVVLSLAEHNGSYSVAFKNLMDWTSRIEGKLWEGTPMLLLSTSPGRRGGMNVLSTAAASFPHMGATIAGQFSLPLFRENFDSESGVTDANLSAALAEQVSNFTATL